MIIPDPDLQHGFFFILYLKRTFHIEGRAGQSGLYAAAVPEG